MKRILLLILIILSATSTQCAKISDSDSIASSLSRLDDILARRTSFENNILSDLNKAQAEFKTSRTPEEQYNALRSLFNLYRTYKIDSALIVADRRLETAKKIGEPSKIASATLNLAEGYAKSGNTDFALFILDTLQRNTLAPHQLKYLNSIYKTLYTNKLATSMLPHDRMDAMENLKRYRALELEEIDKNSRGYLLLQAERLRDAGLYDEALAKMEEMERNFDIESNPALLYELGATYLLAGKDQEAIMALSKAAILDISGGSKEYKSLILLASALFDMGEVDRAFNYINCALEDATFSKANLRTEEIIKIMPNIYKAFSNKEKEIRRRTAWFLGAIGVLNILLFFLLALLIREHNIKKRIIHEVEQINQQLEKQNLYLEKSDKLKMEHLKRFMMAYANHISSLKAFRKNILRLLRTSQYNKAIEKIKSENDSSPDSNAFQEMFDAVFLSMFPDFIEQINSYLKQPMDQKSTDRLTPELRIAALMKLGITSTREITDMFQYSAQSVYNLRSSLRSLLKVNWEDFEREFCKK